MSSKKKKTFEDPGVLLRLTDKKEPVAASSTSKTPLGCGTIVLNRPKKLNSLSYEMVSQLSDIYTSFQKHATSTGKQCVLLEGVGRGFCAGGDVDAIRTAIVEGEGKDSLPEDFFYDEYVLNHQIATSATKHELPQIAIWDGFVMGGGVGISVHGSFRVATENSLFAMPETGIGLFPDVGGTYALPRVNGGLPVGIYIGLTGVRLKAPDLLYSGLATHYCPSSKLPELREALSEWTTTSRSSLSGGDTLENEIDAVIRNVSGEDTAAIDLSSAALSKHQDAIQRCFSKESLTDVFRALESEGDDDWAASTLATMKKMSPLSMRVTFEALQRNCPAAHPTRTLAEALNVEYRLAQRFMRVQPGSDFCEGIRAVLVDKDHSPKWAHDSVGSVKDAEVNVFFSPLDKDHGRGELTL
eukprot:g814.t1